MGGNPSRFMSPVRARRNGDAGGMDFEGLCDYEIIRDDGKMYPTEKKSGTTKEYRLEIEIR